MAAPKLALTTVHEYWSQRRLPRAICPWFAATQASARSTLALVAAAFPIPLHAVLRPCSHSLWPVARFGHKEHLRIFKNYSPVHHAYGPNRAGVVPVAAALPASGLPPAPP
jgi:hypothetical protein